MNLIDRWIMAGGDQTFNEWLDDVPLSRPAPEPRDAARGLYARVSRPLMPQDVIRWQQLEAYQRHQLERLQNAALRPVPLFVSQTPYWQQAHLNPAGGLSGTFGSSLGW